MRDSIVAKLQNLAVRCQLGAVICASPENFGYVAGFIAPSQPLIRHRHAMAIIDANGGRTLLGVDMEETTIRSRAPGVPLVVWKEFSEDPMAVLAEHLKSQGLGSQRIGLEFDYLPAGDAQRLQEFLPAAQFVAIERDLSALRQIKTPQEIDLLRRLSRIADQAIHDSLTSVKAGDSELDIAAVLTRRIYELGAENFKLLIVATGERSQLPNVGPSSRILQTGDVCRVEIFSVLDGYQAGVCRTAYVQEPPPMAERIWQLMVDCKYKILEQVKPGASCLKIYQNFIEQLKTLNLPPISFVGHGVGLHLHEDPYLGETPLLGNQGMDAQLQENMVMGFEPLCYRTGYGFGVQNKDVLRVTADGSELLSDFTHTDKMIRIG